MVGNLHSRLRKNDRFFQDSRDICDYRIHEQDSMLEVIVMVPVVSSIHFWVVQFQYLRIKSNMMLIRASLTGTNYLFSLDFEIKKMAVHKMKLLSSTSMIMCWEIEKLLKKKQKWLLKIEICLIGQQFIHLINICTCFRLIYTQRQGSVNQSIVRWSRHHRYNLRGRGTKIMISTRSTRETMLMTTRVVENKSWRW